MKHLIGYIRVSTEEQGKTKNGLDAQRAAILRFADENGYHIVEIVEEIASGKLDLGDRPVLAAVTAKAMKTKAYIVVNKLDRLSRSASFIGNLMDNSKARFIVTELGEDVDPFMLRVYAAMAQKEREMIAQRTRDALQALIAKGRVLGASVDVRARASAIGTKVQAEKADEFARKLQPTISRMRNEGMTLRQIADELNNNGTRTARGGLWAAATVNNMIIRLNTQARDVDG
jgi:DNA invertase Pin-like site-specific DNA recombinase